MSITAADFASDVKHRRHMLNVRRSEIAAVLLDPEKLVSDSVIAELAAITAKQQVLGTLDENITALLAEGRDDAEVLALVTDRFQQSVTRAWQPNSTSNVAVEVDLKKHFYSIEVLNTLRGVGFGGI